MLVVYWDIGMRRRAGGLWRRRWLSWRRDLKRQKPTRVLYLIATIQETEKQLNIDLN